MFKKVSIAIIALALVVFVSAAFTAPADLDFSFGVGGVVRVGFRSSANAVALQTDGKIVVGLGFADFALARFNSDGSPDSSFGSGGFASNQFGLRGVVCLALQPDGKIVAGFSNIFFSSQDDFNLVRYNTDGSLDTSFGSGGRARTDFLGFADVVADIVMQPDGKIIAAGSCLTGPLIGVPGGDSIVPADFAVARYTAGGLLDSDFGIGGRVTTPFSDLADRASAVALQQDGGIVVVGNRQVTPLSIALTDFAAVRYLASGSLDPTFGTGGKVITDFFGKHDGASDVVVQPDGKILVCGIATDVITDSDFAVVRYNSDGTLDAAFGAGGKVTTDFGLNFDMANAMSLRPDGAIIVAGLTETLRFGREDFALATYRSNGVLDQSFGVQGQLVADFMGDDRADDIALQPDGKILVIGTSLMLIADEPHALIARYKGASVDLDTCIRDDVTGNLFQFSSSTGDYRYSNVRKGLVIGGKGTVATRFCKVQLQDARPGVNISATANTCTRVGTASIMSTALGGLATLSDRNMSDSRCTSR
jgi:uncharacterized delta-60 repeat protein